MSAKTLVTGRETMTSKERVRAFFSHQPVDRVPIDALWNPGILHKTMEYFGVKTEIELKKSLGCDFQAVSVNYVGPKLHADITGKFVDSIFGWHTREIQHESGSYFDYCDFPLANAGVDEVAAWPIASPDDFDYDLLPARCEEYKDFGLYTGGPGLPDVINSAGCIRGVEQVLIDLITDEPAGVLLFKRMADFKYQQLAKILEVIGDRIDFIWMGEDLGTQIAPMISMDVFRKHILPVHKRFIDLAKKYNLPTMLHTCGSSSWAYEDFINAGLSGVDTLQPEATNMSPKYLKQTFGGRLVFHGCISTTGKLTSGTPDEVREECRKTLEIMMPGGGYALCPSHQIQDNTPLENVLAMYETANKYGWY